MTNSYLTRLFLFNRIVGIHFLEVGFRVNIWVHRTDFLFDCDHVTFTCQSAEIGTSEVSWDLSSDFFQVYILVKFHFASLRLNDFNSLFSGFSNTEVDHLVEPASSEESGVEKIWSVGGSNNKHPWLFPQPIDFRKQLCHYSVHHLTRVG